MHMESFNDPQMGVSGLKPDGWSQPELGLWVRLSDQAVLFQRGIPNMTGEQVRLSLLPQFDLPRLRERAGGTRRPRSNGNFFTAEAKGPEGEPLFVDAALAQAGEWALHRAGGRRGSGLPGAARAGFPASVGGTGAGLYGAEDAALVAQERVEKYAERCAELCGMA